MGFGRYTSRFTPQFGCLGSLLYALVTPLVLLALAVLIWWIFARL